MILRDRTVLITGAGGSIGSELARQVFLLRPRRLVLVDRAESALYLVQRELEARRGRDAGLGTLRAHLANVASRPAMDRLIADEKPDVIFHAAAYKHVPMMEEHPSDAVHVNIGGTLALLDAAVAADVGRFVLVSTDKAVRPSSVMGASKRIAEMLVADAAQRTGRSYVSVRFGNVLGSSGSVVPIFQDQLEKGEPLTITHPDMSRYFMTIPEAAGLIVDAAALGSEGDLFVLDMGDPIRIVDLARDLVRLAGRDPDTQPMDIVGLRPGEKLHEELFYDVGARRADVGPQGAASDRAVAPGSHTSRRRRALRAGYRWSRGRASHDAARLCRSGGGAASRRPAWDGAATLGWHPRRDRRHDTTHRECRLTMAIRTGAPASTGEHPNRTQGEDAARVSLPIDSSKTRDCNVAVIGLGYTGLPLAISFVEAGLKVEGIDAAAGRVADLNARRSPIDDVSDDRLGAALDAGLTFVMPDGATLADADAIFVCVPTPITATKDPDLTPVLTAASFIGKHLRPGQLVILQSTTYPGHDDRAVP